MKNKLVILALLSTVAPMVAMMSEPEYQKYKEAYKKRILQLVYPGEELGGENWWREHGKMYETNLVEAAQEGLFENVKRLIELRHVDPNQVSPLGGNALSAAATRGHEDIVRYLLAHGADRLMLTQDELDAIKNHDPRIWELVKSLPTTIISGYGGYSIVRTLNQ